VITYPVASPHVVVDATAFVLRRAGWQPGWQLQPIDHAAGGLIASAEHLLTWARFQKTGTAADGETILSQESLARLHTAVVNADTREDVALDWFVRDVDGAVSIGHGGSTAGYLTELVVVPEHDFAFVGLTNATNGSWVNDAMRRWTLARFAGLYDRDLGPDPSIAVEASRFVGSFVHAFAILTLSAGSEPGQLVLTASRRDDITGWQPPLDPPRTLALVADDHAVAIGPGPQQLFRFGFDVGGRLAWLQEDGRRAPRV
jgi:CubicO group peptidase (beta-lactamase class C family)